MKLPYKALVLLFNLCLFISAIILPALTLASSPEYYSDQFEKNGIYARVDEEGNEIRNTVYYIGGNSSHHATFDDGQLDEIIEHIIDYLFRGKESFELTMDGVMLNGKLTDGVAIFGQTAVLHMADVKLLMNTALAVAIISAFVCCALLIFFFIKKELFAPHIVKYTVIFYAAVLIVAVVFCLWSLSGVVGAFSVDKFVSELWSNMHHLFFPFQPEKIENSSFNDTLTFILEIDLFMDAVVTVLSVAASLILIWVGTAIYIKKKGTLQKQKS